MSLEGSLVDEAAQDLPRFLSLFQSRLRYRTESRCYQCAFGDIVEPGQGNLVWDMDASIPAEAVRAQGNNIAHGYISRRGNRLREQTSC